MSSSEGPGSVASVPELAIGDGSETLCDACGHRNPTKSRFCNSCSRAISGPVLDPPSAELPAGLASKIRAQQLHPGERKRISALFADVVESMPLAERLGAERWQALMDCLFSLLCGAVHRYEGTVQDFTGDGILALFGAPIAHEDHARRACQAALEIIERVPTLAAEARSELELDLELRVGINSGEVVVGAIGEDHKFQSTAVGHAIGLARRVESLAEPGTAYLSAATAAMVSGYFDLSELGAIEVKGAGRQRVFRLESTGQAQDKLERSQVGGLSGFVGRESEMEALNAALQQARRGAGQAVALVAEAGTGKSRLAAEFARSCSERGVTLYATRGRAEGTAQPMLAVRQLLCAYLDLDGADFGPGAAERASESIRALEPGLEDDTEIVLDLLGLSDSQRRLGSMSAEARQRRQAAALQRVLVATAERGPSLTVVEDLHWIDPASRLVLGNLIPALTGRPAMFLFTFRPEFRPSWSDDLPYRQLQLPPLGGRALAALIDELLGADPSLDGVRDLLAQRTGGNPFFVEEAVAGLEASGALAGRRGAYRLVGEINHLEVPASVQATLAAQIDRLQPESKSVLRAAAAIGGDFGHSLLARVLGLTGAELDLALAEPLERRLIEVASEEPRDYRFRHPLIREVAYDSQLTAARARTHRAIAEAIQDLDPDRLEERAGLVADHLEAAGDWLDAAQWHVRAGSRWVSDPAGSELHLRKVRALDARLPEGDERDGLRAISRLLLLGASSRVGGRPEALQQLFDEGAAAARRRGDRAILSLLHGVLAVAVGSCRGDAAEAARLAEKAAAIAEDVEESALQVPALMNVAWPLWLGGRYRESLARLDRILELTEEDHQLGAIGGPVANPRAEAATLRVLPLLSLGRLAEARGALEQGAELGRRWYKEALGQVHALHCMMAILGADEGGEDAVAHGEAAVAIGEEVGGAHLRTMAAIGLGGALVCLGELRAAGRSLQRSLSLIDSHGVGRELEPSVYRLRARAAAQRGDFDSAVAEGARALRMTAERGLIALAAEMRCSLAHTLIVRAGSGDAVRAAVLLDEAEEIARGLGAELDLAHVAATRSELADLRGNESLSAQTRASAIEIARRIDARGLLSQLRATPGGAKG